MDSDSIPQPLHNAVETPEEAPIEFEATKALEEKIASFYDTIEDDEEAQEKMAEDYEEMLQMTDHWKTKSGNHWLSETVSKYWNELDIDFNALTEAEQDFLLEQGANAVFLTWNQEKVATGIDDTEEFENHLNSKETRIKIRNNAEKAIEDQMLSIKSEDTFGEVGQQIDQYMKAQGLSYAEGMKTTETTPETRMFMDAIQALSGIDLSEKTDQELQEIQAQITQKIISLRPKEKEQTVQKNRLLSLLRHTKNTEAPEDLNQEDLKRVRANLEFYTQIINGVVAEQELENIA